MTPKLNTKIADWVKANLSPISPPIEVQTLSGKSVELKVGDTIHWENDYGVTFTNTVIGFDTEPDKWGNYFYMDTDAYWSPFRPPHILSVNDQKVRFPTRSSVNNCTQPPKQVVKEVVT